MTLTMCRVTSKLVSACVVTAEAKCKSPVFRVTVAVGKPLVRPEWRIIRAASSQRVGVRSERALNTPINGCRGCIYATQDEDHGGDGPDGKYLPRAACLLFSLVVFAALKHGETLWRPDWLVPE